MKSAGIEPDHGAAAIPVTAALLRSPKVRHGFFTRQGGVSSGVYASLNGGVGSRDDPDAVAENRRRMAAYLGIAADRLLVPYQIHSAEALAIEGPFPGERPRCDALVTAMPGLGLGVTGADCGILLFADLQAGVIGATHAGWKGALDGIIEATIIAMEKLGARRASTAAVIGPTIGPRTYEVGPEFVARFISASKAHAHFFAPSPRDGHSMFDLPGFIGLRLEQAGIYTYENLGLDTYDDDARFYSYRRSVHRNEPDYGRQVAAITLA
jgi:YfiH family protein